MNKYIKKLLLVIILSVVLFSNNKVYASSVPYRWKVGEEVVEAPGATNKAKTATIQKEGKVITLTLNNYKGGQLELECYGTGVSGIVLNIVLIGNNEIYADYTKDYGIKYNGQDCINFQGDGSLSIYAKNSILANDEYKKLYINPSKKINSSEKDMYNYELHDNKIKDYTEDVIKFHNNNKDLFEDQSYIQTYLDEADFAKKMKAKTEELKKVKDELEETKVSLEAYEESFKVADKDISTRDDEINKLQLIIYVLVGLDVLILVIFIIVKIVKKNKNRKKNKNNKVECSLPEKKEELNKENSNKN